MEIAGEEALESQLLYPELASERVEKIAIRWGEIGYDPNPYIYVSERSLIIDKAKQISASDGREPDHFKKSP